MDNLNQLKILAEVFNTDKIITGEDTTRVLEAIVKLLSNFKQKNEELNKDTKNQVESVLEGIFKEHDRILASVEKSTQNVKFEAVEAVEKALERLKEVTKEVLSYKAKDGEPGLDADEEKIVEEVLAKIKLPEYEVFSMEEKGEEIVAEVNALPVDKDEYKIDASHIKNLPESRGVGGSTARNLYQLGDVSIDAPANNDVLKYNSATGIWENGATSGTGTVTSVAATVPTGLTISGSPITAAGTLAIGLDTGYVIPLQSTLDAKLTGSGTATYVPFYSSSNVLTSDSHFYYNSTTDILHVHGIAGDATDGLLIESENGTDIAIMGAANTANVSWYGSHNFGGALIQPTTNDGTALGSSSNSWSDLFLASGGVINFNNGDVTLTHSANLLTLAGGDLALGANNLILTGSIASTGSRVTKVWATDIESTNIPTVGGTAILTSLTAPQFTTIELGHASDTTLSRVSAGVIAVEGVVIPSISSTNTLTNKTLQGAAITGALTGTGAYIPVSLLNSGTSASSTTFWRGDGTWATPSGGGSFIGVRTTKSSVQSIGTTLTAVTFDTDTFDTDTMHDTSTNNTRITFTTAGYYLVTGVLNTDANAVTWGGIRLNGSTYIHKNGAGNAGASTANGCGFNFIYEFSAADYIEMMGAFGTTQNSKSGVDGPFFSANKIG